MSNLLLFFFFFFFFFALCTCTTAELAPAQFSPSPSPSPALAPAPLPGPDPHLYYSDPNLYSYAMKDPAPLPPYNNYNGLNYAGVDMLDYSKMGQLRPVVLRRRSKKQKQKAMYGNLGEFSHIFQPLSLPPVGQLKPRTEDIWEVDGKAKHLEVLLLFVILAGLLLKVAFSLLWWKQHLGGGGMGMSGWPPQQSGWGWRQLDSNSNSDPSILNQLTTIVEKALEGSFKGKDKVSKEKDQ